MARPIIFGENGSKDCYEYRWLIQIGDLYWYYQLLCKYKRRKQSWQQVVLQIGMFLKNKEEVKHFCEILSSKPKKGNAN